MQSEAKTSCVSHSALYSRAMSVQLHVEASTVFRYALMWIKVQVIEHVKQNYGSSVTFKKIKKAK